ncbi:metallophosphoesterase [Vannielia litorea]|uniref:metallophosphoesterase n=1 Tax=Vannielia litorea TaxID=1217970 RepID=UPI001BD03FFD|nr:metallophosphoesterase [Vannielia litorea]MBS8226117.1 serine/threonine protein phosphatase [Vannielia litorea]
MRVYAIGDIHGHLDQLEAVHQHIAADKARVGDPDAPVVHIGDLVDRGPDSAGVIAWLLARVAEGQPFIVLKGNHDRLMAHFLRDPSESDPLRPDLHWFDSRIGGRTTLASYGIEGTRYRDTPDLERAARVAVPAAHQAFLEGLPDHWRAPGLFFAHAGIRPGVDLSAQVEEDLVWIREAFLFDTRDHGVLVVHGHTPVKAVTHYGSRLNIDSGAAYGGPLSAVVIEDKGNLVARVTGEGRVPVTPEA